MFISLAAQGKNARHLTKVLGKAPGFLASDGDTKFFYPVMEDERVNAVFYTPGMSSDAFFRLRDFCKMPANFGMDSEPVDMVIEILPVITLLTDSDVRHLFRPMKFKPLAAEVASGDLALRCFHVNHTHVSVESDARAVGLTLQTVKPVGEALRQLTILCAAMDDLHRSVTYDTLLSALTDIGDVREWLGEHEMLKFIEARLGNSPQEGWGGDLAGVLQSGEHVMYRAMSVAAAVGKQTELQKEFAQLEGTVSNLTSCPSPVVRPSLLRAAGTFFWSD